MLSKTLYPKTKIIVRRKKLEDSVLTYTSELEVEVNFDDVDPSYFEGSNEFTDDSTKSLVNSLSESKAPESDITNEPSQESGEDKKPRRFQKNVV